MGANNNYPAATRVHKIGNDLFRDADEPIFPVKEGGVDLLPNPRQNFAQLPDNLPTYERLVPPPTLRYDAQRMALRDQRMLGRPHGGTVVVHFLKRHEWFLETSLALLGRHTTWDGGFAPYSSADSSSPPLGDASGDALWDGQKQVKMVDAATNWGTPRMYGSPLIRQNGYIAEGRESSFERLIKLPVDEQPKGKGVWGRLRGKPKLRLSDPDADDDEEDDSASEEDSSSASDEQTTASASSSNNSQVQPSSQPSSSLSSSQLEDSSADSESSTLAAPSFVVQPHHGQR